MSYAGYFCLYSVGDIFCSCNYNYSLIDCVNGLLYHLSGQYNKIKLLNVEELTKLPNVGLIDGLERKMHTSTLIKKRCKHYFYKAIKVGDGVMYIFSYKHNRS